jgi:tRNA G18 (ribose-2'-O)-methylase SpoU
MRGNCPGCLPPSGKDDEHEHLVYAPGLTFSHNGWNRLQMTVAKDESTPWVQQVQQLVAACGVQQGYAVWRDIEATDWCICPILGGTFNPKLHMSPQTQTATDVSPNASAAVVESARPLPIPLPTLAPPDTVLLLDMPERSERDLHADLRSARIAAVKQALQQRGVHPSIVESTDTNYLAAVRCYEAYVNMSEQAFDRMAHEPIRRSAERVAHQIFGMLRHVKAKEATNLRNTDRKPTTQQRTLHPIVLVLDNVRSAYNVGSLFRTAETAGVEEVMTCGITCHPPHPKLSKTALSATEHVQYRHFDDVAAAIDTCKAKNYTVVAMETTNEAVPYDQLPYSRQGVALVLGNEMFGVDPAILAKCDHVVQIPTFGVKNSLNVASAAPVAVYEAIRQWRQQSSSLATDSDN